ncbi:MAG: DUF4198 domain-containing protein [Pseudomonadota bacterium]
MRPLVRSALALLVLAATQAGAHDTWFSTLEAPGAGGIALALSTGNRYPQNEFNPGAVNLQQRACRSANGKPLALEPVQEAEKHLALRAAPTPDAPLPLTCWAELKPFTVDLPADKVALYFDEIRPNAVVRAAWADMQQRGVPWNERYTKYARAEVGVPGSVGATAPAPVGMAMDIVPDVAPHTLKPRAEMGFQVLRDGKPLADFPVELVSNQLRFARWTTTDQDGRARVVLPFAGGWLLRGTDLRRSETTPDHWESRFVTLVFELPR